METMARFEHGGDVYSHAGVLDFSANLNPLGMPQRAKDALAANIESFDIYPDPQCRALSGALAQRHGIARDNLVITAGASDLLLRLCLVIKPKRALVTAPCFSGYEHALEQVGVDIVRHQLREANNFDIDQDFLESIQPGIECVFLCSPNNPTGRAIDLDLMDAICQRAQHVGAYVVLDECFIELASAPSFIDRAWQYENLVVMRAFTKTFSMAGLRLGYGLFPDSQLAAQVRHAGCEWAVSTPAQVAGLACLHEPGYAAISRAYVENCREQLLAGMEALGLYVVPGCANYLLFKSPRDVYEALLERDIMVRRCQNYHGLAGLWYRVAVRTQQDNERLLRALQEVYA